MRTQAKTLVSSIGLGVLGVSYFIGAQTAASSNLNTQQSAASETAQPTATPTASASPTPTASAAKKTTTTTKKTTSSTSKKKTTSSSSSGSSTGSGSSSSSTVTKTSDSIRYKYGQVTLKVTKSGSKISAIDVGNSSATEGRAAAFPYLVQYAIDAQGTNFGNLGGATFTSEAFKQALSNALGKF